MANPKKSKVVGKRPYAKKSAFWDNKKTSTFTTERELLSENHTQAAPKIDSEIAELGAVVNIIDGWDSAQKARNLRFIFSKYEDHIN